MAYGAAPTAARGRAHLPGISQPEAIDLASGGDSDDFATGARVRSAGRSSGGPPAGASAEPPDYRTYHAALTELVNLVAGAKGIQPYNILGPNTVSDLARLRPKRRQELEAVQGMGLEKLRKYGHAILDVSGRLTRRPS